MKKKIASLIIAVIIITLSVGYYMYQKPVASLKNAQPDFEIGAQQLLTDFQNDEATANVKYLDKIIAVKGNIKELIIDGKIGTIFIETEDLLEGIACEVESIDGMHSLNVGDAVSIKGRCTGYLSDVVLVGSIIIK